MGSTAFAITAFSAIDTDKRSWPDAANYWAWRSRKCHRSNPRIRITVTGTKNSPGFRCASARFVAVATWSSLKTLAAPNNASNQGHIMSNVSILAGFRPQRGRLRRRYRGSLSITALDGRFFCRTRTAKEFQRSDLARSVAANSTNKPFNGCILLRSRSYQPFNAHRASIVERFSPIRF